MITASEYKKFQVQYFNTLTDFNNPTKVTLQYLSADSSASDFTEFTGDTVVTIANSYELSCLYSRNINDKQRKSMGVSQDVTDVVYISPLELLAKTGNIDFPDYVRNTYKLLGVLLFGELYDVSSIKSLEPITIAGESACLCYQMNLKRNSSLTSIN